ncbi:CNOT6L [Cordylochernes scorpioides]|uniref:CNOT6L n=1 Tax=Cordylochernes scorpioides TaxID=51811 RepID=A0ABY6KA17_9ARAC|nr:CNOT6L [Cordylochernes scorpioides]
MFSVPPWEILEVGYIVLVWTRDKHRFEDRVRVANVWREKKKRTVPLDADCSNFVVNDKEHGKPPKRFEDKELQALLDEEYAQTYAASFNVTRQAVLLRSQIASLPRELSDKNKENLRTISEILLKRFQRKLFFVVL